MKLLWYIYKKKYVKAFKEMLKEVKQEAGADIKCPRCNLWLTETFLLTGEVGVIMETDNPDVSQYHCEQCGKISLWNFSIAPVALRCDGKGVPINE